jgi:Histidine kinase-, DNA gyrase B-, and HSP90-like ATPase
MVTKNSLAKGSGARNKEEIKSVPSTPAKSFFVSMLTRDIELQDAILDLLDNCVDGAIRSRSKDMEERDSLKGYGAIIKLNKDKFTIEDNCGGIPWKIAKEYAFCMGKPEEAHAKAGSIGVFGIGMKRAIFKMGRECHVHSNHKEDSFLVSILPRWFEDNDLWEFPAERATAANGNYGTIIEVTRLEESASMAFGEGSTFRRTFPDLVADSYSYLIGKGFSVRIGRETLEPRPVKLCFESPRNLRKGAELIRPYIYQARIDGIDVFLAVGYRSPLRTETEQERDAVSSFAAREAGWTVICNDRVVLSNDRTVKTGWGFGGVPQFHNQFSCIAGIVEFTAKDTASLPVTTTKRGIDTGKEIYAIVRQRMQEGLKYFTKNTNRWKGYESDLKGRFSPFVGLEELKGLSTALPLSIVRGDGIQRQYVPDLPEKKVLKTTRRICFTRKTKDIERVSEYLFDEVREPNDVGEECFDRALKEAKE